MVTHNTQSIVSAIMAQTKPKAMWPLSNITHPGNWPVSAVMAIEFESFHRNTGDRSGGKRIVYFNSIEDYNLWMVEENMYIQEVDPYYYCHIDVYEWEWGPVLQSKQYLG